MENDFTASHDDAPMSSTEAREALGALDTDRIDLASRVVTPTWYHSIWGMLFAVLIFALGAVPRTYVGLVSGLCTLGFLLLMRTYKTRYGVWISSPAGPRSRRLYAVIMAVVIVGAGAALALRLWDLSAWWVVVLAAVTVAVAVPLGRRYDEALRQDIRQGR